MLLSVKGEDEQELWFLTFLHLGDTWMLRLLQVSESTAKPIEELLVPGFVLPGDSTGK